MNNTTTQPANEILDAEIAFLAAPTQADQPGFDEWQDEVYAQCADCEPEPREDHFRDDVEADADTLASAGYGTDEDYGYYGGDDY